MKKNVFKFLIESDKFRIATNFELPDWSKESHVLALAETLVYYDVPSDIIREGLAALIEANDTGLSTAAKKLRDSKGLKHISRGLYSKTGEMPAEYERDGDGFKPVSGDEANDDGKEEKKKTEPKKAASTATTKPAETEQPVEQEYVINNQKLSDEEALEKEDSGSIPAKLKAQAIKATAQEKEDKKTDENIPNSVMIGGKNKALSMANPLDSDSFNEPTVPTNTEFNNTAKKKGNLVPAKVAYSIPFEIRKNIKAPKHLLDVFERMTNTMASVETAKYSYFSNQQGGAGRISAQAGELMALFGSTLSDADAEKFFDGLLKWESDFISDERAKVRNGEGSKFIKKAKNGNLLRSNMHYVDSTWIQSAKKNRTAIMKRLRKQHGKGVSISAGAWDTKEQTTGLGLENYTENKGFSTDIFLRVKLPNGHEILDEVSLKKNTEVNFLNSGAGKFEEWDSNIPDAVNQKVYASIQRDNLGRFAMRNTDSILNLIKKPNSALKKLIDRRLGKLKDKNIQNMIKNGDYAGLIEMVYNDTINDRGSRHKSKILREAIWMLAKDGNEDAIIAKKELEDKQSDFIKNTIAEISKNKKLKDGMLTDIKAEFPLKAISEGEETMAIGEYSLDRDIMTEIFGTADFDIITEQLDSHPGPPPFLGYTVESTGKTIPIAKIDIREDGVGYGGQIKFDMRLHGEFAKILATANKKIYES